MQISVCRLREENGVEIESPIEGSKLSTNPCTLVRTRSSFETNKATTGVRSVMSLDKKSPASLGGIMFELMTAEVGEEEADYWCRRLGFIS